MGNQCTAPKVKESEFEVGTLVSPRKSEEAPAEDVEAPTEEKATFEQKLENALKLPLPFVDGQYTFKPEATENLKVIAELLKQEEAANICLRVFDYTGKGLNLNKEKLVGLSLERARAIREALTTEGCTNKIAAMGMGAAEQGARCLLEICSKEEVETLEKEVGLMVEGAKEGETPPHMELTFSMDKQLVLRQGEGLAKPDMYTVARAWFGEPGSEWQSSKKKGISCGGGKKCGVDVTPEVKKLLENGDDVRCDAALFGESVKRLAPGAKTLTLDFMEKEDNKITFYAQPLGTIFEKNKMPLTVSGFAPKSIGMAQGVKKGWSVKAVNDQDISGMSFADAITAIKEVQAKLPPLTGKPAAKESKEAPAPPEKK